MCVYSEVICTRLVHQGCIWEVNESMDNLVQMTHFQKFSPFRKWGYVQGVQHVTIGIIPSFGTDPACKTLNRFKFLYIFREVRIPNSSWIFKIGADECNIQSLQSLHIRVSIKFAIEHANCYLALEQIVDMCAEQDSLDVGRSPRYLQEYTLSRGWPLTSNVIGMVGSLFRDTSIHLHLSQLNCSLWAEIQSDSASMSARRA